MSLDFFKSRVLAVLTCIIITSLASVYTYAQSPVNNWELTRHAEHGLIYLSGSDNRPQLIIGNRVDNGTGINVSGMIAGQQQDMRNAIVRFKTRMNGKEQYCHMVSGLSEANGTSIISTQGMTTHHSYNSSVVVKDDQWVETEIRINSDLTYTYYHDTGQNGSGTLSNEQYQALATGRIVVNFGDCYTSDINPAYLEVSDISVMSLVNDSPSTNISGSWDTSEGTIQFRQSGNQVSGFYRKTENSIEGVLNGTVLDGYWIKPSSQRRCNTSRNGSFYWGRIKFVFNQTTSNFTGDWGYCDDIPTNSWSGTRSGESGTNSGTSSSGGSNISNPRPSAPSSAPVPAGAGDPIWGVYASGLHYPIGSPKLADLAARLEIDVGCLIVHTVANSDNPMIAANLAAGTMEEVLPPPNTWEEAHAYSNAQSPYFNADIDCTGSPLSIESKPHKVLVRRPPEKHFPDPLKKRTVPAPGQISPNSYLEEEGSHSPGSTRWFLEEDHDTRDPGTIDTINANTSYDVPPPILIPGERLELGLRGTITGHSSDPGYIYYQVYYDADVYPTFGFKDGTVKLSLRYDKSNYQEKRSGNIVRKKWEGSHSQSKRAVIEKVNSGLKGIAVRAHCPGGNCTIYWPYELVTWEEAVKSLSTP